MDLSKTCIINEDEESLRYLSEDKLRELTAMTKMQIMKDSDTGLELSKAELYPVELPSTEGPKECKRKNSASLYGGPEPADSQEDASESEKVSRVELPSSTTPKGPKRRKICLVCGDRAIGCNFGVVSCESCKAFFRRMAFRTIRGRCAGTCVVDTESRVYCKSCRLKKCLMVGMKREMIVNDARLKVDVSVAQNVKQDSEDSVAEDRFHWSDRDQVTLTDLYKAFQPMYEPAGGGPTAPGTMDIINMADASVRRLISCVKGLDCFSELTMASQIELLKYSAIEVLILSSTKQYNPENQSWQQDGAQQVKIDRVEEEGHTMMREMMSGYIVFVTALKPLLKDDLNVLNLMIVICLLSLETGFGGDMSCANSLSKAQEQYAFLLQRYTRCQYSDTLLFPRLIMKLADLKYLKELHSQLLNSVDVKLVAPLLKEVFSVH